MTIHLLAFGITHDILGQHKLPIELPVASTVGVLRAQLFARYPELARLRSLGIAVNESYAPDDHCIEEGDEVVLIPPVSGG